MNACRGIGFVRGDRMPCLGTKRFELSDGGQIIPQTCCSISPDVRHERLGRVRNGHPEVVGRPPSTILSSTGWHVMVALNGKSMGNEPEISGCGIVLVGHFNPAIFHPAWLISHAIEPDIGDDGVKVEIVHADMSMFSFDTRRYRIEQTRFDLWTPVAPWVAIADITVKIFGECLVHTPIRAFGINRFGHFNARDMEMRTRIGRKFAPIEPWGKFGAAMESKDEDHTGGLQSLTMQRKSSGNEYELHTNATIQPSAQLDPKTGIYLNVNFHHELRSDREVHGAEAAMRVLQDSFQDCVNEAEEIFNTIMEAG